MYVRYSRIFGAEPLGEGGAKAPPRRSFNGLLLLIEDNSTKAINRQVSYSYARNNAGAEVRGWLSPFKYLSFQIEHQILFHEHHQVESVF